MTMLNQVVRVKRDKITTCMSCPLCNKILRDATTISECLHTFCRKCIYKKLSDELESCPVCDIDLGCAPCEKLRSDHIMQDVRAKIFPFKRRKVNAPEAVPSVTLLVKRKEKSLSSLAADTPVSTQTTLTGKRTKSVARRAYTPRGSLFSFEKPIIIEDTRMYDIPENLGSPKRKIKLTKSVSQNSLNEVTNAGAEDWNPLNYLVEVENWTKSCKLKSEPRHVSHFNELVCKTKDVKDLGCITEDKAMTCKSNTKNKIYASPLPRKSIKPKRQPRAHMKTDAIFRYSCISPQALLEARGAKREKRNGPIWFSLVASEDQEADGSSLPPISASYFRIKDGNVPVSIVQKYLMTKLNLASQSEVEIKCMGRHVIPTLKLQTLVDLWLQTISAPDSLQASVGASAKDFVMVLDYSRKTVDPYIFQD